MHIRAGLEKLTNVSKVNDRLFPVELMEITDWKSRSEYMLHWNLGKTLSATGESMCTKYWLTA